MSTKISTFLKHLILGKKKQELDLAPTVKNQLQKIKLVWNNEYSKDFGIERIIRLGILIIQFAFPAIYVREIAGRYGLVWRKIGIEIYVTIKLILIILFFKLDLTDNTLVLYYIVYTTAETIIFLIGIIFLSDVLAKPLTYKRSITLLFINYIEINLSYAIIYSYCSFTYSNFFHTPLKTDLQAIYFSFVTSATIGYGDFYPVTDTGRFIVITQIILFIIFIGLFISFFISKIAEDSYKEKNKGYIKNPKD